MLGRAIAVAILAAASQLSTGCCCCNRPHLLRRPFFPRPAYAIPAPVVGDGIGIGIVGGGCTSCFGGGAPVAGPIEAPMLGAPVPMSPPPPMAQGMPIMPMMPVPAGPTMMPPPPPPSSGPTTITPIPAFSTSTAGGVR